MMISDKQKKKKKLSLTKDFNHFVEYHTELTDTDIQYVKNLFKHDHIKKTLRIALILLLWSFMNIFLDVTLMGWGIVETAVSGYSILHFVPWLLLVVVTYTAKYIVISKVDDANCFSVNQKLLASVPFVGIIFFLSSVFSREKQMFRTTRAYLNYVRKRGITFLINLLNRAVTLK